VKVDIRLYRPSDRAAVRRICCDTADAGGPLEALFGEPRPVPALRELFADLLTGVYIDHMKSLVWVATRDERVVGYVTGCLNESVVRRRRMFSVMPGAILRALWSGVLWRRSLLEFGWANRDALCYRDGTPRSPWRFVRRPPIEHEFPAHLHINLSDEARGAGVGSALLNCFLEVARAAATAGVTASVREDNRGGRAFFERNGFMPLARQRLFRLPSGITRFAVIHGRRL